MTLLNDQFANKCDKMCDPFKTNEKHGTLFTQKCVMAECVTGMNLHFEMNS